METTRQPPTLFVLSDSRFSDFLGEKKTLLKLKPKQGNEEQMLDDETGALMNQTKGFISTFRCVFVLFWNRKTNVFFTSSDFYWSYSVQCFHVGGLYASCWSQKWNGFIAFSSVYRFLPTRVNSAAALIDQCTYWFLDVPIRKWCSDIKQHESFRGNW